MSMYVHTYVCVQVNTHVNTDVIHTWSTKPINNTISITLFQDTFTVFFLLILFSSFKGIHTESLT